MENILQGQSGQMDNRFTSTARVTLQKKQKKKTDLN